VCRLWPAHGRYASRGEDRVWSTAVRLVPRQPSDAQIRLREAEGCADRGTLPSVWRRHDVPPSAHVDTVSSVHAWRPRVWLYGWRGRPCEASERSADAALRIVAEIDELCPRWPRWPKFWPPPPPPPPWWNQDMTGPELLVFGARFLAASEIIQQGQLRQAVAILVKKQWA
jgi:hypothetical protein